MGEAIDTLKWIESRIISKKKYEELSEEERIGKYPTGILHHDTNKLEYCKAYQQVQEKAQAKKEVQNEKTTPLYRCWRTRCFTSR